MTKYSEQCKTVHEGEAKLETCKHITVEEKIKLQVL